MLNSKKWKITKLNKSTALCDAAKIILNAKIDHLLKSVDLYFESNSVENLHDVRIALRRIRYNMELFVVCFEAGLFSRLYKKIEKLQDLSGLLRDLDVFKENMNQLIAGDKVRISKTVFIKIEEKRKILEDSLKLQLMKFKLSNALKTFVKKIS